MKNKREQYKNISKHKKIYKQVTLYLLFIFFGFILAIYITKLLKVNTYNEIFSTFFWMGTFVATFLYVLFTFLTLNAIKRQNSNTLKIFDAQNRPYLLTNAIVKEISKKEKKIPIDQKNLFFRKKLKNFFTENILKKFKRYGLYLVVENRGKGDALLTFIFYDLTLPKNDSKLTRVYNAIHAEKKEEDKDYKLIYDDLIKAGEKKEFFIEEITFLPSVGFKVVETYYINPLTNKTYKEITGNNISSNNPNFFRFKNKK